jgi:hypothetical protein
MALANVVIPSAHPSAAAQVSDQSKHGRANRPDDSAAGAGKGGYGDQVKRHPGNEYCSFVDANMNFAEAQQPKKVPRIGVISGGELFSMKGGESAR